MDIFNKDRFLKLYKIPFEKFEETKLNWKDLEIIRSDFISKQNLFEQTALYITNSLMKLRRVHSVRYRIKDADHLIEKIIRKVFENKKRVITSENYLSEINDLIGIRAIHLFKEEWMQVHNHINKTWDLNEPPTAFFRIGDPSSMTDKFLEKGCIIKEHQYGYRSVHYVIKTSPSKISFTAEIQVRTIFEEGWSEIDHRIRYPYNTDNTLYFQFLSILNRLAGSADEMGSFIRNLQEVMDDKDGEFEEKIAEKDRKIKDLEDKINLLNIKPAEKKDLTKNLEEIRSFKLNYEDINKAFEEIFKIDFEQIKKE